MFLSIHLIRSFNSFPVSFFIFDIATHIFGSTTANVILDNRQMPLIDCSHMLGLFSYSTYMTAMVLMLKMKHDCQKLEFWICARHMYANATWKICISKQQQKIFDTNVVYNTQVHGGFKFIFFLNHLSQLTALFDGTNSLFFPIFFIFILRFVAREIFCRSNSIQKSHCTPTNLFRILEYFNVSKNRKSLFYSRFLFSFCEQKACHS